MNSLLHPSVAIAVLFSSLGRSGCGSRTDHATPIKPAPLDGTEKRAPSKEQIIGRVRSEVAAILKKEPAQIDGSTSLVLVAQGADDLDIVEIVMAVEEAFNVQIPDSAVVDTTKNVDNTLTVQKLAKIVAEQAKD